MTETASLGEIVDLRPDLVLVAILLIHAAQVPEAIPGPELALVLGHPGLARHVLGRRDRGPPGRGHAPEHDLDQDRALLLSAGIYVDFVYLIYIF